MAAVQTSPAPLVAPFMRENPIAGPSRPPVHHVEHDEQTPSPPTPAKRTTKSRSRSATPAGERKHACQYPGCDKSYTKPSRLAEHELSHTGERRHACPQCSQTYLRATHLHSHLRTHLPEEERPYACDREGCDKKFWTPAHLRRHLDVHDQAKVYQCDQCDQSFPKGNLLRTHSLTHMPAGTKPFPCSIEGCTWSFAMKQQLKAHEKTHQANRYTCSHPSHDEQPSFEKWSLLQAHIKTAHPPVCPHEECRGRMFKNAQRLRDHLKVHDQRAEDMEALANRSEGSEDEDEEVGKKRKRRRSQSAVEDGGKSPKLRPIRGGEAGKDYACPEPGCGKKFKAPNSLKTHHRVVHLNLRSFVCTFEGCDKAFAHQMNLNQHLKIHTRPLVDVDVDANADVAPIADEGEARYLTGDVMLDKRYGCPAHKVVHVQFETGNPCHMRFWRVYDVRRHLKADHGLDLEDAEARLLLSDGGLEGLGLVGEVGEAGPVEGNSMEQGSTEVGP